jgi:hypothetical protein
MEDNLLDLLNFKENFNKYVDLVCISSPIKLIRVLKQDKSQYCVEKFLQHIKLCGYKITKIDKDFYVASSHIISEKEILNFINNKQ